jgi:hypothetical protein
MVGLLLPLQINHHSVAHLFCNYILETEKGMTIQMEIELKK